MSSAEYNKNIIYVTSKIYVNKFQNINLTDTKDQDLIRDFLEINDVKSYCFCNNSLSKKDTYILFTSERKHEYPKLKEFVENNSYPSLNILDNPNGNSCQIM